MTTAWRGPGYCAGPLKRGFDILAALAGGVVLAPLFVLVACAVVLGSGRPVFYAQTRVGRHGRPFRLLKFRTMRPASDGLPITARGDARVTPIGRYLRATKLDELPQILNVLAGEMSFVGPRPEVPRYVALYDESQRTVLAARPGLTDPATVLYRDEERLLATVAPERRERFYLDEVLPRKLELNARYLEEAGLLYDLGLILRTIGVVLFPDAR